MKPTQSPAVRQIFTYDISSQRFGIFSLFLGVPSLGLLIYGLLSKLFEFAWIGFACLLASLWLIARLIWRIRFFQTTYENGETVRSVLKFVFTHGDEINVSGEYIYKKENYGFSTTLQKTSRTKNLAVGDQIWLIIDQDKPKNVFIQDLYIPDSPEEIRQPFDPKGIGRAQQAVIPEIANPGDGVHQIKIQLVGEYDEGLTTKTSPSEAEIIKMIKDVYAFKASLGILEINGEENIFMQIGSGGSPLDFCAGPEGPVYEVSAAPIEVVTKCFLSLHAGDDFWKTALPWEIQKKKVRAKSRKKVPS